jgi:threonyl-tRNA synthetase
MLKNKKAVFFFCNNQLKDPVAFRIFDASMQLLDLEATALMIDENIVFRLVDKLGNEFHYVRTNEYISEHYPLYLPLLRKHFADFDFAGVVNWHEGKNAPDAVLTVHTTGDVVSGYFGQANPVLMRNLLLAIEANRRALGLESFKTVTEATHWSGIPHGDSPSLIIEYGVPLVDIEIGSNLASWSNETAAQVIAQSLPQVFDATNDDIRVLICVGGVHIESAFTEFVLGNLPGPALAVSHILPNHWIVPGDYDKEQGHDKFQSCVKSIIGGIDGIIYHASLKGAYKNQLNLWAEQLGVPILSHKALRQTGFPSISTSASHEPQGQEDKPINLNGASSYEDSKLYRIRHSTAHVMAQAVLEIFPEGKIGIGPPISEGFYYDFQLPRPLIPSDLETIEARMKEIIRKGYNFCRREISLDEAQAIFAQQPYKLELIENILNQGTDEYGNQMRKEQQPVLTIYRDGNFEDLCRGPHIESTYDINPDAVKLLSVAGAYWRGDERRPMLQRIYGTAWETHEELTTYLKRLEEAKLRDHRTLGKTLDLFSTSEAVGPGLILWHPKGAIVRYIAERFSQDAHIINGYEWVYTPHVGKANLWQISGHLDFYKESMYNSMDIENEQYYLKPMNCPFHIQIYKSQQRSYKDLPKRYAEFGTVYRYELSGAVHGLTRVRGFTQDDAHIFCLPEQVEEEIFRALKFSLYVLRTFGLKDFKAYIATRPEEKAVGSIEDWDKAVATMCAAVEREGISYEYDRGGGAFYGPKIDLKVMDVLSREWQLSTVQFDFNLPERFELEYTGRDGQSHRPVMVHRALWGSAERFFGMLIEHYKGDFPLWLAPIQVTIISIADRHIDYVQAIADKLKAVGIRVQIDDRPERMNSKIRDAEVQKIPYTLVVGDQEITKKTISVRSRENGNIGSMTIEEFIDITYQSRNAGIPEDIQI